MNASIGTMSDDPRCRRRAAGLAYRLAVAQGISLEDRGVRMELMRQLLAVGPHTPAFVLEILRFLASDGTDALRAACSERARSVLSALESQPVKIGMPILMDGKWVGGSTDTPPQFFVLDAGGTPRIAANTRRFAVRALGLSPQDQRDLEAA